MKKNVYLFLCAMIMALGVASFCCAADDASVLRIEKAVICRDVVDRTPVGSGDVMSGDVKKIYCFTKVLGAEGETEVTHNWYYKGSLRSSVVLPVRSSAWRTWSYKTISPEMTGQWMVEILSEDGTPLDSIIFFVQ